MREKPPLRLHHEIETPNGRFYRWAGDEPKPQNVPSDARDSSTMPGGYETGGVVLPRKPEIDYSDLERFSTFRTRGPGGHIVFEGRLQRAPKDSGDRISVGPECVGWQAHLDDRKDAAQIYGDLDLSRWGPGSRAARAAILTAGYGTVHDPNVKPDVTNGLPSVVLGWTGPWNPKQYALAQYDAGPGVSIGAIYYDFLEDGGLTPTDTGWEMYVDVKENDDLTGAGGISSNLRAASGSGYFTPSTAARFAALELLYSTAGAAGTDGTDYTVSWRNMAVYGNHGLTRRGSDPGGFYPSDIVEYAIKTWCPLLNYTTGADGTIRPDTFIISHLAIPDGTFPSEHVKQASRFGLQDWAVWDNRTFWWHERGAVGRKWRARSGPSKLSATGEDADRVWNSIIVEYHDVDGTTKTVGPPGSGADTTSSYLEDTDPDNPANKRGLIRRDKLQMGVSTPEGAIYVGRRFLEETKALDTSGKAEITGYVEDDRGVVHPYWRIRAGDQICFPDADDTGYRRIVRAGNDHPTRTCSIDLDAPPQGLAAILERLSAELIPLGFS